MTAMMTPQFNSERSSRGIEWCDYTWNMTGGCEYGCRWRMPDGTEAICYAEDLAENGLATKAFPQGFNHHYWRPNRIKEPAKEKTPSLIFMDSMSDLFGPWVPDEQVVTALQTAKEASHHVFIVLTKTPGRLMKFVKYFPQNLWVLVSSAPDVMRGKLLTSEQKLAFLQTSLKALREVGEHVPVVGMSIEPLSWDIAPYMVGHPLKWVIIGAATHGRKKFQPNPAHVQGLMDVFVQSDTPVFFKGNLQWEPRHEDFPVVGGPFPAVLQRQENARQYGWPLNSHLLLYEHGIEEETAVCGQMSLLV